MVWEAQPVFKSAMRAVAGGDGDGEGTVSTATDSVLARPVDVSEPSVEADSVVSESGTSGEDEGEDEDDEGGDTMGPATPSKAATLQQELRALRAEHDALARHVHALYEVSRTAWPA